MRNVREIGVILAASLSLAAFGVPAAEAGVTCASFPSWCTGNTQVQNPPSSTGSQSTPEPGTLGLLALGAAVGIARMRRTKK